MSRSLLLFWTIPAVLLSSTWGLTFHTTTATTRQSRTTTAAATSSYITTSSTSNSKFSPLPVPPDMTGITEQACLDAAALIQRVSVPLEQNPDAANTNTKSMVEVSFIHWPAASGRSKVPPIVLIHGFDSSCLEYRRLGPQLAALDVDTYAVDLLGWGFTLAAADSDSDATTTNNNKDFSARAKIQALQGFLQTVIVGNKNNKKDQSYCIAGASLGGAAAIEIAADSDNDNCVGAVLIDAQGFVDGIGPMASLPTFAAQVGVQVLKSLPLRRMANQMSYYDKERYATEEAVTIGRLHCLQPGWSDALVSFMQSGGFSPSSKVSQIDIPTLILWGRQDGILEGEEFAYKFVEQIPNAELQWMEECGHVPHLEQPEKTAETIATFLREVQANKSVKRSGTADGQTVDQLSNTAPWIGLAAAAAATAGAIATDLLPLH